MRHVKQVSHSVRWLIPGMIALAALVGCQGEVGGADMSGTTDTAGTSGGSATATTAGTTGSTATGTTASTSGTSATGTTASTTGTSGTGATGSTTGVVTLPPDPVPCTGAADARLVVAPQRILRLTLQEMVNSIKSLVDATEAQALLTSGSFGNIGAETDLAFPPLDANREGTTIDDAKFQTLDNMAQAVSVYVGDPAHFTTLTKCPATPTDACATAYLNTLAQNAYRRPLAAAEQTRLTALYNSFKSSVVNGWTVTNTVQEATQNSVYALLSTPQLVYRSEIGDATKMSTTPPGIPLTPYEMATQLAFFVTDSPPDAPLLADVASNAFPGNLTTHLNRLLATQTGKDWMRLVMYTFYGLNFITNAQIDTTKVMVNGAPLNLGQLVADERIEAQKFLDNVMWNGNLVDLVTSTKAFVNDNIAKTIYNIPVPAGANATTFVQTTLPAERIGLLTSGPYLMTASRADRASVVPRGKLIRRTITCVPTPGPPADLQAAIDSAKMALANQTAQQEVATRAAIAACTGCHGHFDQFGLVLDNFDVIGRTRTVDEINMPVDTHTTLPPEIGGVAVSSAIDLAQQFASATSPVFTNCMAQTVLQYALTDIYSAPVKLPNMPGTPFDAACATTDVANRYNGGSTKTFSDMVRAVAAAPAFALRTAAP